jgi:hypothetical protein
MKSRNIAAIRACRRDPQRNGRSEPCSKLAPGAWPRDDPEYVSRAEREHPRFAHEAVVTVRLGNAAVEGRTRNVSRGGVCADVAQAVAVGADILVDLALVFDEAQSEPLQLPARVVWCTMVDHAYQLGIAFRVMDAERAEYLGLFLRYLDDSRIEKLPRDAPVDERFG